MVPPVSVKAAMCIIYNITSTQNDVRGLIMPFLIVTDVSIFFLSVHETYGVIHTVPQQLEAVRDLLRSCSRGRTAGPPRNVLVLLQRAVDRQRMID